MLAARLLPLASRTGERTVVEDVASIREGWAMQVAARPGAQAVRCGDRSVTYVELDHWSNALAATVYESIGFGPGPVAIASGHDADAVAAIIAVNKLGRPFVVVDTTAPDARIHDVLEIAQPAACLVATGYLDVVERVGIAVGPVVPIDPAARTTRGIVVPDTELGGLFAISFTSGSTGAPKGVMIGDEQNLDRAGSIGMTGLPDGKTAGVPQPLSFAFGLNMLTRALLWGATVCLLDPRRDGVDAMVDWVLDNELFYLCLTPHGIRSLSAAAAKRGVVFDSLRSVSAAGEALLHSDLELIRACTGPDCVVYNHAGSSEGGVITSKAIPRDCQLDPHATIPVGSPLPGRQVELRGSEGDTPGSMVITWRGVARGYWKNAELTAARFTELADGRRSYDSGDLARWNEDGELVFAGRSDDMLKIRGYLVEPAEIESHLLASGEIVECSVIGRPTEKEGVLGLVAYVVAKPDRWVSVASLRRRLASELPSYMVPQTIIELDALPRNRNGKLDRAALPAALPRKQIDSPRPPLWNSPAVAVAAICINALGLEDIGNDDNIFELGADSLAVEEILSALDSDLHIKLSTVDLMEHPTVREIASIPRSGRSRLTCGVAIELATRVTGRPIFLVAGGGALAIAMGDLARGLGEYRPVIGLQAPDLEGRGFPNATVGAAARRYLRAVKRFQPTGPYDILGNSYGCWIAYEMSRRLVADGKSVASLGLIDPLAEGDDSDRHIRMRFGFHSHEALDLRKRMGVMFPAISRSYRNLRRTNLYEASFIVSNHARRRYRFDPQPLRGVPTTIYRAEESTHPFDFSPYLDPYPNIETIRGDHMSMLRNPFVGELIRPILDAVNSSESSDRLTGQNA